MCMLVPQVASGSDSQAFDNKLRIANERKSIKLSATSGKQQEGARCKNMKCACKYEERQREKRWGRHIARAAARQDVGFVLMLSESCTVPMWWHATCPTIVAVATTFSEQCAPQCLFKCENESDYEMRCVALPRDFGLGYTCSLTSRHVATARAARGEGGEHCGAATDCPGH